MTAPNERGATIVTGGSMADSAVDCTAPATAALGEYAHRLAIPGARRPLDGERRVAFSREWTWDAARHGWQRTA